jgi:hypothetical protein
VSKRRAAKRRHVLPAWIAVLALLIDALLPTAVSAATMSGAPAAAVAPCSAASTPPAKHDRALPIRHCALCAPVLLGLSPGRSSLPIMRRLTGVPLLFVPFPEPQSQRPIRNDVQPRAPPGIV